ncbi:MAG TPA: nitroreductase family protein [Bryobacteraceae bacterium]|nr:nitroreductase family protein [Bryobacteraceae bacterium]
MIKGTEIRKADRAIDNLFLDRWSPRAMSGESIPHEDLMSLFEAARWAPSSFNEQPWRILYARRESEDWPLFFDLLTEGNKAWARNAAALLLFLSNTIMMSSGKPSRTHSFDTGAAWENLALQGTLKGYVVHGMQGFDYDRAREVLDIPESFQVEAMIAVGKPGPKEALPERLQQRESPNARKPVEEFVREGSFRFSS